MTSEAPSNDIQMVVSSVILGRDRGPLFAGSLVFASRRMMPGETYGDYVPPVLDALEDIDNAGFAQGFGPERVSLYGTVVAHDIRENGQAGEIMSTSFYGPRDSLDYWHNILVRPNDPIGVLFLWKDGKLVEDLHDKKPLIFVYSGEIAAARGGPLESFLDLLSEDDKTKYGVILKTAETLFHFVHVGAMDRIRIVSSDSISHRVARLDRANVLAGMEKFLQTRILVDHFSALYKSDGTELVAENKYVMYSGHADYYAKEWSTHNTVAGLRRLREDVLCRVWNNMPAPVDMIVPMESLSAYQARMYVALGTDGRFAPIYFVMPSVLKVVLPVLVASIESLPVNDRNRLKELAGDAGITASIAKAAFDHPHLYAHDDASVLAEFVATYLAKLPSAVPGESRVVFMRRRETVKYFLRDSDGDVAVPIFKVSVDTLPGDLRDAVGLCTGPNGGILTLVHSMVDGASVYTDAEFFDAFRKDFPTDNVLYDSADGDFPLTADFDGVAARRLWTARAATKLDILSDSGENLNKLFWALADDPGSVGTVSLRTSFDSLDSGSRDTKTADVVLQAILKRRCITIPDTATVSDLRYLECVLRFKSASVLYITCSSSGVKLLCAYSSDARDYVTGVFTAAYNARAAEFLDWYIPLGVADRVQLARVLWCVDMKPSEIGLKGTIVRTDDTIDYGDRATFENICGFMQIPCPRCSLKNVGNLFLYGLGGELIDFDLLFPVDKEAGADFLKRVFQARLVSFHPDAGEQIWFSWALFIWLQSGSNRDCIKYQLPDTDDNRLVEFLGDCLHDFYRSMTKCPQAALKWEITIKLSDLVRFSDYDTLSNDDLCTLHHILGIRAPRAVVTARVKEIRTYYDLLATIINPAVFGNVVIPFDVGIPSTLPTFNFSVSGSDCPDDVVVGVDTFSDIARVLDALAKRLPVDILAAVTVPNTVPSHEDVEQFATAWARTKIPGFSGVAAPDRSVQYLSVASVDCLFDTDRLAKLDAFFGVSGSHVFTKDADTLDILVSSAYAGALEVAEFCVSDLSARYSEAKTRRERSVEAFRFAADIYGKRNMAGSGSKSKSAFATGLEKLNSDYAGCVVDPEKILEYRKIDLDPPLSFSDVAGVRSFFDAAVTNLLLVDACVRDAETHMRSLLCAFKQYNDDSDNTADIGSSTNGYGSVGEWYTAFEKQYLRPGSPVASDTSDASEPAVELTAVAVTITDTRQFDVVTGSWVNNERLRGVGFTGAGSKTQFACGALASATDSGFKNPPGHDSNSNYCREFAVGRDAHGFYLVDPFLVLPNGATVGIKLPRTAKLAGVTFGKIVRCLYGAVVEFKAIGVMADVVLARAIMVIVSYYAYGETSVRIPDALRDAYLSECCFDDGYAGERALLDVLSVRNQNAGKLLSTINARKESFMYARYRGFVKKTLNDASSYDILCWFAYTTVADFRMFIGRDDYEPGDADRLSWSPAHDGTIFWTGDRLSSVTCSVSSDIPHAILDNVTALRNVVKSSFVASSKSLYRVFVDFGFFKPTSHQCRLVVGIASRGLCAFKTPGSPWHCMIHENTFPTAILRRLNLSSVQVPTLGDFAAPMSSVFLHRMAHSALLDWRSSVYIPLWFALPYDGVSVEFLLDKKPIAVVFKHGDIYDICALVTKQRVAKNKISQDSTVPVVLWSGTVHSKSCTFYFLDDQYADKSGKIFRVSGSGAKSTSDVCDIGLGDTVTIVGLDLNKVVNAVKDGVPFGSV